MPNSPAISLGARIKQARIGAGLSLRGLADKTGNYVSAQVIHKYELGKSTPGSDVLIRLGRALGVKSQYFLRPLEFAVDLADSAFRKRSTVSVKAQLALRSRVREYIERYLEVESFFPKGPSTRSMPAPHKFAATSLEEIEYHARTLRKQWRLGLDPIPQLIEVLEDCGARVFLADVEEDIDGLSSWANGSIPVIVVKREQPTDRLRFSIAHELGHLVLDVHDSLKVEKAANRFAAAFLVPMESAVQELGQSRNRLSLAELMALRQKYGLSVQGWILRARDLGIISASYAVSIIARLKASDHFAKELGAPLSPERSTRFDRLVMRAVEEDLASPARAAELLDIPLDVMLKRLSVEGAVEGSRH